MEHHSENPDHLQLEKQLNEKYSIESFKKLSKTERGEAVRQAFLDPRTGLESACRAAGVSLERLADILRDNKVRAREFLGSVSHESGHEGHDHGDVEHSLDSTEQHSEAALKLLRIILDPQTFTILAERPLVYQKIEGWNMAVVPFILENNRPGWQTAPVIDADSDPVCGPIICDLQGNIVRVEGAQIIGELGNLRDKNHSITVRAGESVYAVQLGSRTPRASLLALEKSTSSPSSATQTLPLQPSVIPSATERGSLDNGTIFRLLEVKDTSDAVGKITIEKHLQERLEQFGFRSKDSLKSVITSLLSHYSDAELGLRVEDERAGWKKFFGGGKIRGLTFITKIPEAFLADSSSAAVRQGKHLVIDQSRIRATPAAERAAAYTVEKQLSPAQTRGRTTVELGESTVDQTVRVNHFERLRNIMSVWDAAFYREWFERTPERDQGKKLSLILRYGVEQYVSLLNRQIAEEKNAQKRIVLEKNKQTVMADGYQQKALEYVFQKNNTAPDLLHEVLYHGRAVSTQLTNGKLDTYLSGMELSEVSMEDKHILELVRQIVQTDSEHEHRDTASIRDALRQGVLTVIREDGEILVGTKAEFHLPGRKLAKISIKPENLINAKGKRVEGETYMQYEFHMGKSGLLEIGIGMESLAKSSFAPHLHFVHRGNRVSTNLEWEAGFGPDGFSMEIDGWVQWYDAAKKSELRHEHWRGQEGYTRMADDLREIIQKFTSPQEKLPQFHQYITTPRSDPASERLRAYFLDQAKVFSPDLQTPQVIDTLFLRALRNYDLALQESATLYTARHAPRITGVKFGLLLEDGAVIPLFGPILRNSIRLRQSTFVYGTAEADREMIGADPSQFTAITDSEGKFQEQAGEKAFRKIAIEKSGENYRFSFPQLDKLRMADRTAYEVYADDGIRLTWDRKTNRLDARGFSFALERTIIGVNGRPTVRLELYKSTPHPHEEGHDHHHEHAHLGLFLRSWSHDIPLSNGKRTGAEQRTTITATRENFHNAQQPKKISAYNTLEQQQFRSNPVGISDRRRFGAFTSPRDILTSGIQFIPGVAHVH